MRITLTVEQQDVLLAWAGENTAAEVTADCEPSGYSLVISICPPFGYSVEAVFGARRLDLGLAEVELTPTPSAGMEEPHLEDAAVRARLGTIAREK